MAAKIASCCGCIDALLLCCSLAHLFLHGDEPGQTGLEEMVVAAWKCDCSKLHLMHWQCLLAAKSQAGLQQL
jgi:hypothetical protein